MATPQPNLADTSIKPIKIKGYSQQTNKLSFWAFLLSIFIYISIFYIFNLSPSSLFNTTKFWFFISNTLILIIAADFGTFSSSRKHDFYDDYVKNNRESNASSFELQYPKIVEKKIPQQEKVKEVVAIHKSEVSKNKLEIVVKDDLEKAIDNVQENTLEVPLKDDDNIHEKKEIEDDEKKIVFQGSQAENREPDLEENEFSNMSDEELNKRVEEFIQKFNRQIRLQAMAQKFQHV